MAADELELLRSVESGAAISTLPTPLRKQGNAKTVENARGEPTTEQAAFSARKSIAHSHEESSASLQKTVGDASKGNAKALQSVDEREAGTPAGDQSTANRSAIALLKASDD